MELEKMYGDLGISKEVLEYGARIEAALEDRFTEIDGNAEYNQLKVIAAMQKNRVSDIHFSGTTGYGYNDLGRETLEQVYADVFHTEDALDAPADRVRNARALHGISRKSAPGRRAAFAGGKTV